jgi:hypothetical protein
MSKYANAQWQGAKEGKGTITTETKALIEIGRAHV